MLCNFQLLKYHHLDSVYFIIKIWKHFKRCFHILNKVRLYMPIKIILGFLANMWNWSFRYPLYHRCVCLVKWVTLVYLYHINRCGHHKKLSIAKLDFVQVCGLLLNFYNNTLRKFYKFSDSQENWASPTLQSADWPISRQYHRAQVRKRVSYPEVY